ncbi:DNA polymerase III subunit chi [Nevskia sp.]|uniref:DNA polymerase III subunit chi n=1 Tax=Nevskia sp. TaxID=1929292 RepID=UPI0025E767A3|nr:DNA polymerase III subunit chi [Nevskia sp.]
MTRIDFYILTEAFAAASSHVLTACKLCDKATAAGKRVFAYVPDANVAAALDSALWTFRQGSFIAHERQAAAIEEPLPAVLIGADEPPAAYDGVMINLGLDVPDFFSRFERVLEIVDADPAARTKSRERYKFYRDRGYELATHNL